MKMTLTVCVYGRRDAKRFEDAACDWRERTMARVYTQYEKMLRAQNGLDFDDLLLLVGEGLGGGHGESS